MLEPFLYMFFEGSGTVIILLMLFFSFLLGYMAHSFLEIEKRRKLKREFDQEAKEWKEAAGRFHFENKVLRDNVTTLQLEIEQCWRESKDDLKKIEGIGPVIENMLNKNGIYKWRQLRKENIDHLKSIIYKGGDNFKIHDPATWPKQAGLADSGKWEELINWQKQLKGGKEAQT